MEANERFDLLQLLLRQINELRIEDLPMNDLAFVYKQAHDQALDDAMNIIRKEL